jgi:pyruvate formate lyase activating enzyme
MAEGQTGLCRVRRHQDGRIISLNHSRVAALAVDPVEKKPLYHFLPGSLTLSFAAPGCNLRCAFCQNHSLSQVGPGSLENTREMAPQEIVDMAVRQKLPSISFTYSEPTVFYEMMRETAELAHLAGIRTILVSNGYINPEPLQELTPFLDAANIDLKAFSERFYQTLCGGHLQPVLDSLGIIKKAGVWLEVTTLLIPGENDNPTELDELIRFLVNLDADIPWHVSRFHPQYRFSGRESTPAGAILGALERGRELGLHHLYAGNLETNPWQDTPCRNCGALLISRQGHQTRIDQLGQDGTCRRCRSPLAGRFNFSP